MARRFNIQPWREELRAAQRKDFVTLTAGLAFIALALCGGYYFLKKSYLSSQERAITVYDGEIASLASAEKEVNDMKKLNDVVTEQINVIQALQDQRSLSVEILDYIASRTPETVFINRIVYKDERVNISGTAENEMGVSSFIRALQEFKHFAVVRLVDMKQAVNNPRYTVADDTGVRTFELAITVVPKYSSAEL